MEHWVENNGVRRDELHRWIAILYRPSGRSVLKRIEALFFACIEQGCHAGKQSQAPKQVLGVVTLHAICEE
jgi:hypothetical protein